MILGAADSGQYGEPPSEELELALDCAMFSGLPRGGGLEGQRAGHMEKLRILRNVHDSFHSMINTSMDQKKWSETYPGKFAIVAHIQRMRANLENG